MSKPVEFLAVLVFDKGDGWVNLHPHTFTASHPEIAFQLALRRGRSPRGSNRFVGLSELKVSQDDSPRHGEMVKGDPEDFIRAKTALSVFQDARWQEVPCDPQELESALSEPHIAFEPQDLEVVDWQRLSHAFGSAQDVPVYLRSLGAEDPEIRKKALYTLLMTILHQGTLYSATVAAIPFLMRLVSLPSYPDRTEVMDFVQSIVRECRFEADRRNRRNSPLEGDEPDLVAAIFDVLRADLGPLETLQSDSDPDIQDMAEFVVAQLKGEGRSS